MLGLRVIKKKKKKKTRTRHLVHFSRLAGRRGLKARAPTTVDRIGQGLFQDDN